MHPSSPSLTRTNEQFLDSASTPTEEHEHEALEHHHDDSIGSVSLEVEGALDPVLARAWLSILLLEQGVDIYRTKGILHLSDRDERFVFQSVYMLFDGVAGRPWGSDRRVNRLVFIGRHLDRDALARGLLACRQR